ncbi:hypothetical protein HRR83_002192 [Exophiala dermatitidis]|uniref:AB hydrolase-1 domain-containing protein n=2 Tax=Exophiala dermatitidis TaxID=5970 RepID=H6BYL2_EXODN|nr:uncharacterized protein HMPREF1120_04794 [Exophiala dermatitidis NIH/UT8656]KAJ4520220.1 hypothetical protein HRR75_002083 [Exophiala dermatitidis]EHY56725.1 hypothetical protein HMPREF1120_04794 [Exophiala dermatitidis NIH/UT8656]KAJ4524074.1 hypothetical protein HRR74_002269 [Exophiala dermatitidis]KAJ4525654.1 hypothetical protein HRR73_002386 [Exophiala dermatitidis]KAJ4536973.1 hypothetical protein HRR76_004998 [Exophiala dermatitidis]
MATEVVATQTPATTVLAPASGIKPSDLTSVSESAVPSTTDNAHVSSDEGSLDVDIESVTAFASLIRFHRRITFYSDSVQCTINVTYGVAGVIERNAPTLLFAGGMYGGRWNAPWVDYLCRQKGVRVIFIDRPGLGGSTPVHVSKRVPVWLETVPKVLSALEVSQVGLIAHSCGIIYAFNTVYHTPELLSPGMPLVLLSPWVHPSKSGVKMLTIASAMPAGVMQGLNKVTSFLVKNLIPSPGDKEGKNKTKEHQKQKDHQQQQQQRKQPTNKTLSAEDKKWLESTGFVASETEEFRNYFIKMFFAEDTTGASEEASLGLKHGGGKPGQGHYWGVCDDYERFVARLAEKAKGQTQTKENETKDEEKKEKLHIVAYFGSKDSYLGSGGQKYLRDVWSSPLARQVADFEIEEVKGLDHDGVALPENGVLGRVLDMAVAAAVSTGPKP